MNRLAFSLILSVLQASALLGQTTSKDAPGAPGADAHWPSAAKDGFGTANTVKSKVWFTLNNGVLSEVFYPRLDVPNTQSLQFVVCGSQGCHAESDEAKHEIEVVNPRALSFQQINTFTNSSVRITKTYTVDPQRPVILIKVSLANGRAGPPELFVYYDPSLNNSGLHDTAWCKGQALLASDGTIASALVSSTGFSQTTNGYLGMSDGLRQLKNAGRITNQYKRAGPGNVVQVARLTHPGDFTLALGFGRTAQQAFADARASLNKGFVRTRREYESGWSSYVRSLRRVERKYEAQFRIAAMVLKGLEDKTFRGGIIASPSIPWGGGANANEANISGYHAVWARDLYHVATAFLALGDRDSANRALDYLFKVQQRANGSVPQNSWIDGRQIGGGRQMDQVALALVLAYQLGRTDRDTWLRHIRPAADLIVTKGPGTEQDRWEEKAGYSPSTIAAEIAGLVCAARMASINSDSSAANNYLLRADEWARSIDAWTATTTGPLDPGRYFLRITENTDPNDGARIEINSGGGVYDEREIVDAGCLELVRLGIRTPTDPLVLQSLNVIDRTLFVNTVAGPAWYRYNHDAYGETADAGNYDGKSGKGRLWTLLTGERGEYDVALGNLNAARAKLDAMLSFANDGLMIPEQVWDRNDANNLSVRQGQGTGSATPLAWSMAQFIRLAVNVQVGRNTETPDLVQARYARRN